MAALQVYTVMTLEGWSDIMRKVLFNYSQHMWIYFLLLIFIGNYMMVNLTLAILKAKFKEAHDGLRIAAEEKSKLKKK